MKRVFSEEYKREIAENHDLHGTPRVRAEWNWNNTSMLSDRARRGTKIRVFDSSGIPGHNPTSFAAAFDDARYRKTINHFSASWRNDSNTPNIDWTIDYKDNYIPVLNRFFGAEQTFYLDVKEAGQWRFGIDSDDSHELWVYDINEENPVKLTSAYGGRRMSNQFTEQANHTFPTVGRYLVKLMLTNVDQWWGIDFGCRTPSMIAANEPMKLVDPDLIINPDYKDAPSENPMLVKYKPSSATKAWEQWREYFPVSSLVDPVRPTSGINYNELDGNAFIMTENDFVHEQGVARPPRHYLLNKKESLQYKFWKSDEVSTSTGDLQNAAVRIEYNDWVETNRITFVANIGPVIQSLTIRYLAKDADGNEAWHEAVNKLDPVPMNLATGETNLYINDSGGWSQQPVNEDDWVVTQEDNSILVKAIEFTIHKLDRPNARAEVIAFSAGKALDVTNRTISFNITKSMDEADWMKLIGMMSANDGSIGLSNWDNAFQLDYSEGVTDEQRLKQITERQTKFTFDLLYDLTNQGVVDPYPVRIATMQSSDWARDGEYDYEVNLFDSAKRLQNIECPSIFEKNLPVHVLVSQILDSIGFTKYDLDREDYTLSSPVVDFFYNDVDMTVWEALNRISESTLCAFFFDEYDNLQMMTKEEIVRRPEYVDYVLRGEYDPSDPNKLPNIESMTKSYDVEANKVTINWTPKSTKKSKDPLNQGELTDILWQSNDTITIGATKLAKPLRREEENYFWIRQEDAYAWQWSGKANINGEIVEWNGKEYRWYDAKTGKYFEEVIYSKQEQDKRDVKALYEYHRVNLNKYTGKLQLKRDPKTGEPQGRGVDGSGYRVDHPVKMRPGWTHNMFTIGNPGFVPGWWRGEQNTSFYQIESPDSKSSAVGINRPTNSNDDWFKTQCIVRKASDSVKLQQWGFRVKFKESTTIGEISLMFNMGQSFGNSEVVTTAGGPSTFNQMYHLTFLETQNLVRNATHEIAAWVQSPDPVYRTHDNAIRGSASRMYCRGPASWEDRMKGQQYEFKRDVWYDIKVDLTRGRGYTGNDGMHFFVWVNGTPVAGFDAAGPPNRHKYLAPTNYWAIGSRAASKLEISNAYSWTEFTDPEHDSEKYRYDFTSGGYVSSYLEDGILYPAKGASAPYRDGAQFHGEFFFDDMGSTVHEIREFDITLEKAPATAISFLSSNGNIRNLELEYTPNNCKFSVVNISDEDAIAHGEEKLPDDGRLQHSMVIYGYALEEAEEQQSTTKTNRNSIKDRGEVAMDIEASLVNSRDQADELGKWVVRHFAEPKDVLTATVFGDASYSVGDKVNVHYSKLEIDKEWLYVVTKVTTTYDTEGLALDLDLRRVRNNKLSDDDLFDPSLVLPPLPMPEPATERIGVVSGTNTSTWRKGMVGATEMLIPFQIENGSVGFLGGNSYSSERPGGTDHRSPVGFRSNQEPKTGLIVFDSAYKAPGTANGDHLAGELVPNKHVHYDNNFYGLETTVIPNDGFSFARTGRQIISYQSVNRYRNPNTTNMSGIPGEWRSNVTSLAFSDDGQNFTEVWRVPGATAFWQNDASNSSPFIAQSWQDGFDDYVYMISVKAGRQTTPMMLQRVYWDKTFYRPFYQGWRKKNGVWGWGKPDECTSLFDEKVIGEPSLRRFDDGTWAMSYTTNTIPLADGGPFGIVTRTAPGPTGPWSPEKVQVTQEEIPNLAGGYIHPYSDAGERGMTLFVSEKTADVSRVIQVRGTF